MPLPSSHPNNIRSLSEAVKRDKKAYEFRSYGYHLKTHTYTCTYTYTICVCLWMHVHMYVRYETLYILNTG